MGRTTAHGPHHHCAGGCREELLRLRLPASPQHVRHHAVTRVLIVPRRAQRVSLAGAGRLLLAAGPGRCHEVVGQNRPSAI
jgi:hypothetical protein